MKVFFDTLEARYNRCLEYLNQTDIDEHQKKELLTIIHNWPASQEDALKDQDRVGHTRIETKDGRSVRILGFKKDNKDDWPIVAFVTENDGSETLVEYNSYGYRKVGNSMVVDDYMITIKTFYFEDNDYVANEHYYGILYSSSHNLFKFAINFYHDDEDYDYCLSTPKRACTQEEMDELNKRFDEEKWREACNKHGRII